MIFIHSFMGTFCLITAISPHLQLIGSSLDVDRAPLVVVQVVAEVEHLIMTMAQMYSVCCSHIL